MKADLVFTTKNTTDTKFCRSLLPSLSDRTGTKNIGVAADALSFLMSAFSWLLVNNKRNFFDKSMNSKNIQEIFQCLLGIPFSYVLHTTRISASDSRYIFKYSWQWWHSFDTHYTYFFWTLVDENHRTLRTAKLFLFTFSFQFWIRRPARFRAWS